MMRPQTFLERVWSLYCDDYDANETIELDDSRWRPLRDGIVEWQRGHRYTDRPQPGRAGLRLDHDQESAGANRSDLLGFP